MNTANSQDIMENLLTCGDTENLPVVEELNCLIYRNPDSQLKEKKPASQVDQIWTANKDKVTVQVWESRANIRIRVAQKSRRDVSMKSIADIAVNAIIDELRRESQ